MENARIIPHLQTVDWDEVVQRARQRHGWRRPVLSRLGDLLLRQQTYTRTIEDQGQVRHHARIQRRSTRFGVIGHFYYDYHFVHGREQGRREEVEFASAVNPQGNIATQAIARVSRLRPGMGVIVTQPFLVDGTPGTMNVLIGSQTPIPDQDPHIFPGEVGLHDPTGTYLAAQESVDALVDNINVGPLQRPVSRLSYVPIPQGEV